MPPLEHLPPNDRPIVMWPQVALLRKSSSDTPLQDTGKKIHRKNVQAEGGLSPGVQEPLSLEPAASEVGHPVIVAVPLPVVASKPTDIFPGVPPPGAIDEAPGGEVEMGKLLQDIFAPSSHGEGHHSSL